MEKIILFLLTCFFVFFNLIERLLSEINSKIKRKIIFYIKKIYSKKQIKIIYLYDGDFMIYVEKKDIFFKFLSKIEHITFIMIFEGKEFEPENYPENYIDLDL